MVSIERIAVNVGVQGITAALDDALFPIVALFAKALQRPELELVEVTAMRLDVVSNNCRGDDAARETEFA
jgi:hypothetical protein